MKKQKNNDGIVARIQADYFALYINHQNDYDALINGIYKTLKEQYNISNITIRLGIYKTESIEESVEHRIDRAKLVCDEIEGLRKKLELLCE